MKRSTPSPDAPPLFDLPITPSEPPAPRPAEPRPPVPEKERTEPTPLELFPEEPFDEAPDAGTAETEPELLALPPSTMPRARWLAGLIDLGVTVAVLATMVAGTAWMGVAPGAGSWPALALAITVFSFLYYTIPLAFWGQTPGMARMGLVARDRRRGGPLTFGQTFLRWLGAGLTAALAGLPALMLLTGRSLADRLSGSSIRRRPRA